MRPCHASHPVGPVRPCPPLTILCFLGTQIRTALPPAVLEGGAPAAGAALVLSAPSAAGEVRVPLDGGGEPQLR